MDENTCAEQLIVNIRLCFDIFEAQVRMEKAEVQIAPIWKNTLISNL